MIKISDSKDTLIARVVESLSDNKVLHLVDLDYTEDKEGVCRLYLEMEAADHQFVNVLKGWFAKRTSLSVVWGSLLLKGAIQDFRLGGHGTMMSIKFKGGRDTAEIKRLVEQIDFVGYESKGRPLELDPNFKRLAEIFEVEIWP